MNICIYDGKVDHIKATIYYRMAANHPDLEYVAEGHFPDKIYTFSDIYKFTPSSMITEEAEKKAFIKNDLALVAGGGYRKDTIEVIGYEMQLIRRRRF